MSWIQNELARQERERTANKELTMLCALLIEKLGGKATFDQQELIDKTWRSGTDMHIMVVRNPNDDTVTYSVRMDDSRIVEE
jgi:hypothetical protein